MSSKKRNSLMEKLGYETSAAAMKRQGAAGEVSAACATVSGGAIGAAVALEVLGLDVVLWGSATAAGNPETPRVVGTVIEGYTMHGVDSAIYHDGVGVSPTAILETLRFPVSISVQADPLLGDKLVYTGENAVVVLNEITGNLITTYALNSSAYR